MSDSLRPPFERSEGVYRHLFDSAPDLLWMIDRNGAVQMANARTENVLGLAPSAVEGRHLRDLLAGSAGGEVDVLLTGLEEGSQMPEMEADVLASGDRIVPMMLDVSEVEAGGATVYLVRMRDLREIRALEQEYRNLFDGIADAVFLGNPETGQLYQANTPAIELTGRKLGELMGKDYEFVHAETWDQVLAHIDGEELHGYETELVREMGGNVPVEIHVRIAERGDGDRVFIETAIDITARRKLEARMKELRQEWESFMRHELRNPLTPILAFSQILLEDVPAVREDAKVRKFAEAIYQGGKRMEQMLELTREVQQYEHGEILLERFRTDIYPTLRDAILDASLSLPRDGDALTERVRLVPHASAADGSPEPFSVLHDGQKVQRVISNLVKNALEHDPGEVTVRVSDEDGLTISVHNGGTPIPPARLETIFEKYNTTKRAQKGTGLGTTIARLFVEAHGGTIRAESSAADGTTFTVTLPNGDENGT